MVFTQRDCIMRLRNFGFALGVLTAICTQAFAQTETPLALRLQWTEGQVQQYKVLQTTTVAETSIDEQTKKPIKISTVTKLALTKQWTVKSVDGKGNATLELSISAFRQEISQTTNGETQNKVVDSANAEDAKAMAFLNKVAVTATIDATGKVTEAKADNPLAMERLQAEPPFRVLLPTEAVKVGTTWDRAFQIKLPPPAGTGEKFDLLQKCNFKGISQDFAVIGTTTELKTTPDDMAVMPALVASLWEGDVFVNAKTGAYHGAKLTAKKEIANHQGEGTQFNFQSEYTEVRAEK
jgi:hypothetical protein